jgi:hypothetical protein
MTHRFILGDVEFVGLGTATTIFNPGGSIEGDTGVPKFGADGDVEVAKAPVESKVIVDGGGDAEVANVLEAG